MIMTKKPPKRCMKWWSLSGKNDSVGMLYKKCVACNVGVPTGTRTPIDRLGGDCSILLSYRHIIGSAILLVFAKKRKCKIRISATISNRTKIINTLKNLSKPLFVKEGLIELLIIFVHLLIKNKSHSKGISYDSIYPNRPITHRRTLCL